MIGHHQSFPQKPAWYAKMMDETQVIEPADGEKKTGEGVSLIWSFSHLRLEARSITSFIIIMCCMHDAHRNIVEFLTSILVVASELVMFFTRIWSHSIILAIIMLCIHTEVGTSSTLS